MVSYRLLPTITAVCCRSTVRTLFYLKGFQSEARRMPIIDGLFRFYLKSISIFIECVSYWMCLSIECLVECFAQRTRSGEYHAVWPGKQRKFKGNRCSRCGLSSASKLIQFTQWLLIRTGLFVVDPFAVRIHSQSQFVVSIHSHHPQPSQSIHDQFAVASASY